MGNGVATFLGCLNRTLFILAGNDNIHTSFDEFEIRPRTTEYAALERLKTDVTTFFLGCYSSDPF